MVLMLESLLKAETDSLTGTSLCYQGMLQNMTLPSCVDEAAETKGDLQSLGAAGCATY